MRQDRPLSCCLIEVTNQKNGRPNASHSITQGDHYFNHGTVFTCGIQQTTLTGTCEDDGIVYPHGCAS